MKLSLSILLFIGGLCYGKVIRRHGDSDDDDRVVGRAVIPQVTGEYGGYYGQKSHSRYIRGMGRPRSITLPTILARRGRIGAVPVPEYYTGYRGGYHRGHFYTGSDREDDSDDTDDDGPSGDGDIRYPLEEYSRIVSTLFRPKGYLSGVARKYSDGYTLSGYRLGGGSRGSNAIEQVSRGSTGRGQRRSVSYGYSKRYYPGLGSRGYYSRRGHYKFFPGGDDMNDNDDNDDVDKDSYGYYLHGGYLGYYPLEDDGNDQGDNDNDDDSDFSKAYSRQRSQKGYSYYYGYRPGYSVRRKNYGYRSSDLDDSYPTNDPGYSLGRRYNSRKGYYPPRPMALSPYDIRNIYYSRRGRQASGNAGRFSFGLGKRGIISRIESNFPASIIIGKTSEEEAKKDQVQHLVNEAISQVAG